MISNDGRYWTTGIEVNWRADSGSERHPSSQGWNGEVKFYDDGFCDDAPEYGRVSTQGVLRTRYTVKTNDIAAGLTVVVNTLITDVTRLGIVFRKNLVGPTIFYTGDGEWKDYPPPPGWEKLLVAECARLGWDCGQYARGVKN